MSWTVRFGDEFEQEFQMFPLAVMEALLAVARPLGDYGPELARLVSKTRFCSSLLCVANTRYAAHLVRMRN
jgi:hypothetical protein